jgi:hypothetical protein
MLLVRRPEVTGSSSRLLRTRFAQMQLLCTEFLHTQKNPFHAESLIEFARKDLRCSGLTSLPLAI